MKVMSANSTVILCLCLCFLMTSVARPAVYYVSREGGDHEAGSNTAPYDTWAKAATSPKTVMAYIKTAADDTDMIYLDNDVFNGSTDYIYADHANHSGTTILGAGRERTIIRRSGVNIVYGIVADDLSIQNLTLQGGGAGRLLYKSDDCTNWSFLNVDFVAAADHTRNVVSLYGGTTSFRGCRFFSKPNDYHTFSATGDSSCTLSYCLFAPARHSCAAGGLYCASTGTINLYNCDLLGSSSRALLVASGTVNVENCIVEGCLRSADSYPIQCTGGTTNLYHNHIIAPPWKGAHGWTTGTIAAEVGNIYTNENPRFRTAARVGYILPCVDDVGGLPYAQSLATALSAYGMQGTYFPSQSGWSSANRSAVRTMVGEGVMEVGVHSYSHSKLTNAHALTISYSGSDTGPTVALTVERILQLQTIEGNDDVNLNTTLPTYDTLGEIAATGQHNWTISLSMTDGQGAGSVRQAAKATSLAVLSPTAAPCDIDFDRTAYDVGFFKDEILDPKTWMTDSLINSPEEIRDPQTGTTYVCRSFACPFNAMDSGVSTAILDSGYVLGRGNLSGVHLGELPAQGNEAALFHVGTIAAADYLADANETNVRLKARALAVAAVEGGLAFSVLAHNATEMSVEQWTWCLDEWSQFRPSLLVTSHQIFADTVRDSGLWLDDGDGTYSRTYPEYSDYHLTAGSPGIDTGWNLGREYALDFDSVDQDLGGAWEMGAYVYRPENDPGLLDLAQFTSH